MDIYIFIFQERTRLRYNSIKKFIKDKYEFDFETVKVKELGKSQIEFICIPSIEEKYARYFISAFNENQYLYCKISEKNILVETNSAAVSGFTGREMYIKDILKVLKQEFK